MMGDLLPGQLVYVFFVSIVDAALLSWLTLRWYRRTVRRLMLGRASGSGVPAARAVTDSLPATDAVADHSLGFALFEPGRGGAEPAPDISERFAVGRLVLAYCVGAALFSAVITALTFGPESPPLPWVAWLVDWWNNTWPVVPTLAALLVLDRRTSYRLVAVYILAGSFTVAGFTLVGQLLRGTLNTAPLTNVFWMVVSLVWTAWLPLILLLITGWRRIRAVTPLALAVTLLFGFGLMFFREALIRAFNVEGARSAILGLAVLTSAGIGYYGLFMLVSLPVGWLAWWLLRALAHGFDRKRFSDVQLTVDCWWVVVAAERIAFTLSIVHGLAGIAGGVAAFAAYRVGVSLVLWRRVPLLDEQPRRLLLLRVFGYQARTESLFDRVAQRWRFHGPVQLIAGVDLATRTADPGDVLAFVNGRLADSYVLSSNDISQRIGRLDLLRDPDGRYRVNEIYCRDDTWRPALEALLDASDTVLMDLRNFSDRNAGCIFELEQLVMRVAADSVVLVCDKTTDLPLLGRVMGEAWTGARREGRTRGTGQVALVRMEGHSPRELTVLMQRLLGRGEPQRLFAPAELPATLG